MIGILGSGFGLYGYLPALALISCEKIFLLNKSKQVYFSRKELLQFENRIQWLNTENELIDFSDTIVFALPPKKQQEFINKNITTLKCKNLVLEKPLATSPEEAGIILQTLITNKVRFRISYSLIYKGWVQNLGLFFDTQVLPDLITIEWKFLAHHHQTRNNSWKRDTSQGGGIINFYGIHFIAIAFYLGYRVINYSKVNSYIDHGDCKWVCELENHEKKKIIIQLNSRSLTPSFIVSSTSNKESTEKQFLINQQTLFNTSITSNTPTLDPRIEFLQKVFISLGEENSDQFYYDFYIGVNELWKLILAKTNYFSSNLYL